MCNFNCKIRLQTFQMFLTKLKQKYKKIELLKNFCKNQIGFLQSLKNNSLIVHFYVQHYTLIPHKLKNNYKIDTPLHT